MRTACTTLIACLLLMSCKTSENDMATHIIALERGALDRWGKGDVNGYLELYAPEITYFDPSLDKRIAGKDAMTKYYSLFAGKIGISHYEMVDPKLQQAGDIAVLTYNLVDDVTMTPAGPTKVQMRWNSTEIYQRIGNEWKIIHSHWSYIKPELKQQ